MIPSFATLFVSVWAAALLGTSATAMLRALTAPDAPREPEPADARPFEVLLVRPVAGADAWLEGALRSVPADVDLRTLRIRIAVADVGDDAYPIAVRAVAALAGAGFDASVCVTAATGQNRKAAQLANVLAAEPRPTDATREIVIVADADVDLSMSPLDALIAAFAEPGIGAAWAPPVERAQVLTWGDRASQALLAGSLHAFPLLARLDPGGLVGKLCALRRSSLEAIGGFDVVIPWLGEDMRLAALLRARGLGFVATTQPARSVANGRSTSAVLARYARWLQVIRTQRPWLLLSYPALFFGTFPAVAMCLLLATSLAEPTRWLLGVAAALVVTRLAVAQVAARAAGRSGSLSGALVDALLADGLLAAAFCLAMTQRHVAWKTNRLTFDRRGMLREAEEAPRAIA